MGGEAGGGWLMPGAVDTSEAGRQKTAELALCFYQLTAG